MILIILPVKNESKTIKETAQGLIKWCIDNFKNDFRILFIDDGSEDGTFWKLVEMRTSHVDVMKNKFDRGKGSALKMGFLWATVLYKLEKEDLVVFMDGDGQLDPNEIKTFLNLMNLYDADVVIGNKRHLYSVINYNWQRGLISIVFNILIKILFGLRYQDTQCGIKIFKKDALDKVIEKVNTKRYAFDLELIVALKQMRLRIADAPVSIKDQRNKGSVSLQNILNTFADTLSIWGKMRKGLYSR